MKFIVFLMGLVVITRFECILMTRRKQRLSLNGGFFVVVVMMFGLKTTPATFQRVIMEIFADYILAFMQVFLDDFEVYN